MTMAGSSKPLRHLVLAVALAATTTSASPASHLFARDKRNTCVAQDLNACPKALPDNFCCAEGNSCIPLAGNTSALCCPVGQDCDFIQVITCDVSKQDPDDDPSAPIKTTVFDVDLETCGDGCCPFGYSCSDNGLCSMDTDQSKTPTSKKPTTTTIATSEPTSTTASTASPTSTESKTETAVTTSSPTSTDTPADESDNSDSKKEDSSPATTSIIGGVVGGCLVLLLIAVIIFLYVRRNNRRHAASLEKSGHTRQNTAGSGSTAPFGTIISEPIMLPNSYRTDFILKTPSIHSVQEAPPLPTTTSRGLYPRISIFNPFDSPNLSGHSPTATSRASSSSHDDDENLRTGRVAGARLAPIRAMKASSRRLTGHGTSGSRRERVQREPSSENINVFADPSTVGSPVDRDPRHTTFSDLMDEADLSDVRRGRPYVPGATPVL